MGPNMKPVYVLTLDERGFPLTWRDPGTGTVKHARSRSCRTITRAEAAPTPTAVVDPTAIVDPIAADRLKARSLERRLRALAILPTRKPLHTILSKNVGLFHD